MLLKWIFAVRWTDRVAHQYNRKIVGPEAIFVVVELVLVNAQVANDIRNYFILKNKKEYVKHLNGRIDEGKVINFDE